MSEFQPLKPGDIVTVAYFGDMPYHRRIGRVLGFYPASYTVTICDSCREFEATVHASKVAPASREELVLALRSRLEAPHLYVQEPKKPATPPAEPVEEPIDSRYREVLQVALDLANVCDRAEFRQSDHEVVKHALTILNRHLAAMVSPAPAGHPGGNQPRVAVRGSAGAGDSSLACENGGGT